MRLPIPEKSVTGAPASSNGRRAVFIFLACLLLLLLSGWLDYLTGYELGFFVFYTVPIGLAAWYLGRWPGIALALGATIAWWLADALAGVKYSTRFSFWWNSTVHFSAFVINAVAIAKIKVELNERDELAARLEAARRALRAAARILPACPSCGKARPQTGQSDLTELQELARNNPDLSSSLCEECAHLREQAPAGPGEKPKTPAP